MTFAFRLSTAVASHDVAHASRLSLATSAYLRRVPSYCPEPPRLPIWSTAQPAAGSELAAGAALLPPAASSEPMAHASTGSARRERHLRAVEAREGPSRATAPTGASGTPVALSSRAPRTATLKPYLYAEELAELTPWTVEAINTKVKRGELRHGVHYFQEHGRARRTFKWAAIVAFIERGGVQAAAPSPDPQPELAPRGKVIDVEKVQADLQRLLDRSA